MNQLIEQAQQGIERLCLEHHVKYLAVFGSATSSAFTPESDVDLLVEFEEGLSAREYSSGYFGLKDALLSQHLDSRLCQCGPGYCLGCGGRESVRLAGLC